MRSPTKIGRLLQRTMTGVMIGGVISICIIIIWINYANTTYKWSSKRIGEMVLRKYIAKHIDKIQDTMFYNYMNIVVAPDQRSVSGTILAKDKVTQQVLDAMDVQYAITGDCSLFDMDCIKV